MVPEDGSNITDVSGTNENQNSENQGGAPESTGGINPAWNPLLEVLPSSLHSVVTPHLKEWDKGVTQKLEQVQSQYEPFKPFLENDPQQLSAALELYKMADSNPQLLYQELARYYGFDSGQGPDNTQQNSEDGTSLEELGIDENNPEIQKLMQNQEMLAQFMVNQYQKEQEKQLEAQLDQEMSQVLEKYPHFKGTDGNDQEYQVMIYQIATARNSTLTEAADFLNSYNEKIAKISAAPPSPSVLSGNGRLPQNQDLDPTNLSSKDTRALVASILSSSKEQ